MKRLFALGSSMLSGLGYCESKSSEEIFESAMKSSFSIAFIDRKTSEVRALCTGFFITEDGLGITSGPLVKLLENCDVKIKMNDSAVLSGEVTYYSSTPAVGFVQVQAQNTSKLKISKKNCEEGENFYVLGLKHTHPYFSDVFVTDSNYELVKIGDKDLFDGLYIRTTGLVPSECIGGPILDHDGNAVALVFNKERGLAI